MLLKNQIKFWRFNAPKLLQRMGRFSFSYYIQYQEIEIAL